jgi:hypothetical protein
MNGLGICQIIHHTVSVYIPLPVYHIHAALIAERDGKRRATDYLVGGKIDSRFLSEYHNR